MEIIYLYIALGVIAIGTGIWGYFDYRKKTKLAQ